MGVPYMYSGSANEDASVVMMTPTNVLMQGEKTALAGTEPERRCHGREQGGRGRGWLTCK